MSPSLTNARRARVPFPRTATGGTTVRTVYTQRVNDSGGIEANLTVTRNADDR